MSKAKELLELFDTVEAKPMKGSYSILAAREVTGTKPTIEQGLKALDMDNGTILVLKRDGKPIFLSSAGAGYNQKVGDHIPYHMDQNPGRQGDLEVENIIELEHGHIIKKLNDTGVKEKRSWYVMK